MAQDKNGQLSIDNASPLATYSASGVVAPAATATDFLTITGSATKVVKVRKLTVNGTQTTSGIVTFYAIKRSALDTGGTPVTATIVPMDSGDAAATAVVTSYTANPAGLGTAVGNLCVEKTSIEAPASAAANDHFDPTRDLDGAKEITLRGAAENLAINLNGVTVTGGSIAFTIVWTEEPY